MKNYLSSVFIKKMHFFLSFFLFVIFLSSFILEQAQNIAPCILCKVERWSYFTLAVIFLFINKVENKKEKKSQKIYTITRLIAIFTCLLISVYHKFVQVGITKCNFGSIKNASANFETFQLSLENATPCFVKTTVVGIELVWFNIVIFSAIACLEIFFLTKQKNKKN